jgi:hypothetical protein
VRVACNTQISGAIGNVAEVNEKPAATAETVEVPAGLAVNDPMTSQSPAVNVTDVMFAGVSEVNAIAEPAAVMYSPTLPA